MNMTVYAEREATITVEEYTNIVDFLSAKKKIVLT